MNANDKPPSAEAALCPSDGLTSVSTPRSAVALVSTRTREQEAADRIIEAWGLACQAHLTTELDRGKLFDEAMDITSAECARLAEAIRGFIKPEAP